MILARMIRQCRRLNDSGEQSDPIKVLERINQASSSIHKHARKLVFKEQTYFHTHEKRMK